MLGWLMVGCAPGAFTATTAEAAFVAVSSVNEDVFASVWANTDPLAASTRIGEDTAAAVKGMAWISEAEGGEFSGTVEGPGSWTGTVALSGTHGPDVATEGALGWVWAMTVAYTDVRYGETTFDGEASWTVDAVYASGEASSTATFTGPLVCRGAGAGAGEVEAVTEVRLSGGRYVVTVTGTVGEWPIDRSYDATGYAL
jgi:hypothetical protein